VQPERGRLNLANGQIASGGILDPVQLVRRRVYDNLVFLPQRLVGALKQIRENTLVLF
jgi:hypothetical protein